MVPASETPIDATIWVDAIEDSVIDIAPEDVVDTPPQVTHPARDSSPSDLPPNYRSRVVRSPDESSSAMSESAKRNLLVAGSFGFLGICLLAAMASLVFFFAKKDRLANKDAPENNRDDSIPYLSDRDETEIKREEPVSERGQNDRVERKKERRNLPTRRDSSVRSSEQTGSKSKSSAPSQANAIVKNLFSNVAENANKIVTPIIDNKPSQYPATIAGMDQEIGLNHLPRNCSDLWFANIQRLQLSHEITPQTFRSLDDSIGQFEKFTGKSRNKISYILCGCWTKRRGAAPTVYVVTCNESIDLEKVVRDTGARKLEILGAEVYQTETGITFGTPSHGVLVLGTANEVIHALKNPTRKIKRRHVSWLDFRKLDMVKMSFGESDDDYQTRSAYSVKDKKHIAYSIRHSPRHAELGMRHARLYDKLQIGELTSRQFWKKYEELAIELRFPFGRPSEDQIEATQTMANNARVHVLKAREHSRVSYSQNGRVFLIESENLQRTIPDLNFLPSSFYWRNRFKTPQLNQKGVLRKNLEKFETYQFKDERARDSLETRIESGYPESRFKEGVYGAPEGFSEIQFCANHTSSRRIQRALLKGLAELASPLALSILAEEARYFDLRECFERTEKEDEKPEYLWDSTERDRAKRETQRAFDYLEKKLLETCGHYLQNPGDPETLIDVCRILNDMPSEELKNLLIGLEKDSSQPEAVRQAARFALRPHRGESRDQNEVPQPKDANEAVEWITKSFRPQKFSAVKWLAANSWPDEHRKGIAEQLTYMLDSSIYGDLAVTAFCKQGKDSDLDFTIQVVKNALDGKTSHYRQKQHYTLFRVVDVLAHFKNEEGLLLACTLSDYKTRKHAVKKTNEHKIDSKSLIEKLLAGHNEKNTSRTVDILEDLPLDKDSQAAIESWVEEQIANDNFATTYWSLYRKCKPLRKENIPTLVKMWAFDPHSSRGIAGYLKQYKSSVEPQVLDAIRARNRDNRLRLWASTAADLLGEIGTEKSIEVLETYLKSDRERDRKYIRSAIQKIRDAKRTSLDFESFPEVKPGR